MKSTPTFRNLNRSQKLAVARRVASAFSMGGKYDAVEGETAAQRAPALIELFGEDSILTPTQRYKLTNLARQQMRNSPIARTIDQQRRVNVVGLKGGKLTLTFPRDYEASAKAWQDWFNFIWARQAEFTDGLHFNEVLKLALSSGDNSGDVALMFDDGLLDDTGRIRAFESDEIANMKPSTFEARFKGRGWKQSQGRIYDRFGRAIGLIVSSSQRGMMEFDDGKFFVLTADPMKDRTDNFWIALRRAWRFNQGRGVSPSAAAMNTLIDLHNITANETQAANLNAKLFGQIIDSSEGEEEEDVPDAFDPNADVPDEDGDGNPLTDDEKTELAEANELAKEPPEITFESMKAIGAMFDLMPPKLKLELLDTKRPNPNLQKFIDWLSGTVSGVYGLGRVYATLNPEASYTAFRGAQCLSWPSIEEAQKDLERGVCDWAARNAFRWAARTGGVDVAKYALPEGWQNMFAWSWPEMREVNEVDAETAKEKKLSNRTTNYRKLLGPAWKEELRQSFDEEDFFKEEGHIHPAQRVTGGTVAGTETTDKTKKGGDGDTETPAEPVPVEIPA